MTRALYAGSFDPPTLGHVWIINEAIRVFDELIIGVAENPDKACTFSAAQRIGMLAQTPACKLRVSIEAMPKVLVADFALRHDVTHLIRGIRNTADFGYEFAMRQVNADINPELTTVFLTPPRSLCEVSSSFVKGLMGFDGWEMIASKYVTPVVLEHLRGLKR